MNLNLEKPRLTFSGHDSFPCRNLWLKKGYDYVLSGKSFSDEDSVVVLGVGKNMVNAIRYWMKAFDLLDQDNKLTELSYFIFSNAEDARGCFNWVGFKAVKLGNLVR